MMHRATVSRRSYRPAGSGAPSLAGDRHNGEMHAAAVRFELNVSESQSLEATRDEWAE
jgi:hypothetical protein